MRRLFGIIAIFAIASAVFASVPAATAGPSPTSGVRVPIAHWRFHPKILQVRSGTTVVWVNEQHGNHTSISDDGLWNSGAIAPGATFSFTFTALGTYAYHCRYGHGIHGVVEVLAAGG
jgi:plastocyanin